MKPHATPLCGIWEFVWIIILLHLANQVAGDSALLTLNYTTDNDKAGSTTFCVAYNPALSKLQSESDKPVWHQLVWKDGDEMNLCEDLPPSQNFSKKFLAAPRRNCSSYEQAVTAMKSQAAGLIIASTKIFLPGQPNTTMADSFNFPILVIRTKDMDKIEAFTTITETWKISVYRIEESYAVDGSGIILIVIAVVVITIGSFRSGYHRYKMIEESHHRISNVMEPSDLENPKKLSDVERGGVSFGPIAVIIFALFMAALLVAMYYFYDYLVYFFIALFVIGGTSGMFECFKPVLSWTDFLAYRIPMGEGNAAKCCGPSIDIRGIFLFLASLAFSCVWVVYRNAPFGWIFLDLLGSFLLISVLVGIQLPSLKACTIFLCLLFIYDVFFVFITPLFTKDGQSVMIQVATGGFDPTKDSGGGQREVIPAAFKIPHIPTGEPCDDLFEEPSYSLLGFGDVMVPGFLISYLRGFELVSQLRPVYSVPACIGYLISLVVTTVALIFMKTGQPALLYIVPILLIIVFVTAWRRKEVKILWDGNLSTRYASVHSTQLETTVLDVPEIAPQRRELI